MDWWVELKLNFNGHVLEVNIRVVDSKRRDQPVTVVLLLFFAQVDESINRLVQVPI
jgi:hypothetical protein